MQRYYLQQPENTKDEKLFLAAPMLITKANGDTGVVDAFVSIMGNVDSYTDIIHMGAFSKTIAERGAANIRVLDSHSWFSVRDVLGTCIGIEERPRRDLPKEIQERFPDAQGGLWTSTQFMMDDPDSVAAFRRIKSGAINQYSIGFQIVKADYSEINIGTDDEPKMLEVRNIREIKLFEYSPVIFAANEATATVQAKAPNFTIPLTISTHIVKRAEIERKGCESCFFYGKISHNAGYCSKHAGTTKGVFTCAEFEAKTPYVPTIGDKFAEHMRSAFEDFVKEHEAVTEELASAIPSMVSATAAMLPTHVSSIPLEPQAHSDDEPTSTSDEIEAAQEESLADEQKRLALIEQIRHNQETIRELAQGN